MFVSPYNLEWLNDKESVCSLVLQFEGVLGSSWLEPDLCKCAELMGNKAHFAVGLRLVVRNRQDPQVKLINPR